MSEAVHTRLTTRPVTEPVEVTFAEPVAMELKDFSGTRPVYRLAATA